MSRVYIFHFLQNGSVNISDYVRSMAGLLMVNRKEMQETGLGLIGGTTEKHKYPSQDNNT
jgi:hypothetical protein